MKVYYTAEQAHHVCRRKAMSDYYDFHGRDRLRDGVYSFSDEITFICIGESIERVRKTPELDAWMAENPDFVIGSAYETGTTVLLSETPGKFQGLKFGSGFNYGSTNILTGLDPEHNNILILAEND